MSSWIEGRLADPKRERKAREGSRVSLPYADWPLPRTLIGVLAGLFLGAVVLPLPVIALDPDLETYAGVIAAQGMLGVAFGATAVGVALLGFAVFFGLADAGGLLGPLLSLGFSRLIGCLAFGPVRFRGSLRERRAGQAADDSQGSDAHGEGSWFRSRKSEVGRQKIYFGLWTLDFGPWTETCNSDSL